MAAGRKGLFAFRIGRKTLFVTLGLCLVFAGTGAAALMFTDPQSLKKQLLGDDGLACTGIAATSFERDGALWLRRYISVPASEDADRVKTALRVARFEGSRSEADLILVVAADARGPGAPALIRGRAVGAEVLYVPHPEKIADHPAPLTVRYASGKPGEDGNFYGERVTAAPEMMAGLVASLGEPFGCTDDIAAEAEARAAEGHGGSGGHEASAGSGHAEVAPADAGGHGESQGH